jgi:hypothetical protein
MRVMEIKLKTTQSAADTGIIMDEHGVLWNYLGSKAAHGILPATAKALDGRPIQGFYQNGTMFIVNLSDARRYFGSVISENYSDM